MKPHDLGVRDVELIWFTSYLKECKHDMDLCGILPDQKYVTLVPQGSILRPL